MFGRTPVRSKLLVMTENIGAMIQTPTGGGLAVLDKRVRRGGRGKKVKPIFEVDPRSPYENRFGDRARADGRPPGSLEKTILFRAADRDPDLVRIARKRAQRVVHDENRDRLRDVFEAEYRVLAERGLTQVLADERR